METSIWQEYQDEGVIMLGISNTMNIEQFVDENSLTFPIVYDPGSPGGVQGGDTYDLYYLPNDGSPYPRDFIIDQDGIIQYANNEIDTDWMISIINDLIGNSDLVLGDINFDGMINVLDIVNLVNIILGVTSNPSDDVLYAADINQEYIYLASWGGMLRRFKYTDENPTWESVPLPRDSANEMSFTL